MERLLDRLIALDPGALPLLGQRVPLWAGILLAALGLALLIAGSRKSLRRAVAALVGVAAGWYLVPAATRTLGVPFAHSAWVGAGALGVAGLLQPWLLAVVAGGLGGGLLALHFWPGQLLRAALPGLVVGGGVAAVLRRPCLTLAATALGAALSAVGATSILLRTPAAGPVLAYPIVLLVAAGLLFICAAAYQLTRPEAKGGALPAFKRRAE